MKNEPMNILFILSDQHSTEALGCYGNRWASTPNLDTLAANGVTFDNAYTNCPVCVPARASLATGRYPHEIHSWDNASPYTGGYASWGHRLIQAGYQVTTIGKLHFRDPSDDTGFPDQRITLHVKDGIGDLYGSLRETTITKPNLPKFVRDAASGESAYSKYDAEIALLSKEFLMKEAPKLDGPWALNVGIFAPHHPWMVPQKYLDRIAPDLPMPKFFRKEEWAQHPSLDYRRAYRHMEEPFPDDVIRNARRVYYGLCAYIDDLIGQILMALDESGQRDSTMVIYTTDHGEMLGNLGLWYKHLWYEYASRIPLIVSAPGTTAGRRIRSNVSLVDLFPTFLETGNVMSQDDDLDLPGRSLLSMVNGGPEEERVVFGEYHGSASLEGSYMIRWRDFKYIYHAGFKPQLFNIESDPFERIDLIDDPDFALIVERCDSMVRERVDPEQLSAQAKKEQLEKIERTVGRENLLNGATRFILSPPPEKFGTYSE